MRAADGGHSLTHIALPFTRQSLDNVKISVITHMWRIALDVEWLLYSSRALPFDCWPLQFKCLRYQCAQMVGPPEVQAAFCAV